MFVKNKSHIFIKKSNTKAFTIVELLVVITVIGILAAITIVSYYGITNRANIASVKSDLANSSKKIELYYVLYDIYPSMSAPDSNGTLCPTSPADPNYCLEPTSGTSFTYSLDADPDIAFILTATRGSLVYAITKGMPPTAVTTLISIAAVSGTVQIGQTLTAGAITPAEATANYHWQSAATVGGVYTDIPSATSSTYVLQVGDLGWYFRVIADGTGFYTGTQVSAPSSLATTPITSIAAISGTAQVGQTLTAGVLSPVGTTASYQWQSAATVGGVYTNISGATSSTYTVALTITGRFIKVVATGSGSYSGSQTSAATAQIIAPLTAIAAISGTTQLSQTLTSGAVSPAGATVNYQWQSATTAGGSYANISGATGSSYILTLNEVSKYLKVVVTGNGSYSGSQTSAATTEVTAPLTAIGSISGTAQIGQTLTSGVVSPAGATVSYQWQASTTSGGVYTNIAGATSSTYIVSASYNGQYLKVVATGTGLYSGTRTSAFIQIAADANWLTIGAQTWGKYNLNVGTMITGVTAQTNNAVLEKYCYNNLESNCTTYGALYQWNEAMQYVTAEGSRGICPAGSHFPTDNDWKILEVQLGMTQVQADTNGAWRGTDQGTKLKPSGSSGLNVPLAGYRLVGGSFSYLSSTANIWSSSESGVSAWYRILSGAQPGVYRLADAKTTGFSVRCVGD